MAYLPKVLNNFSTVHVFPEDDVGSLTTRVIGNQLASKISTVRNRPHDRSNQGRSQYSQSLLLTSSLSQQPYLSQTSSLSTNLSAPDNIEAAMGYTDDSNIV